MPKVQTALQSGLGGVQSRAGASPSIPIQNLQFSADTFGGRTARGLQQGGEALFRAGSQIATQEEQDATLEARNLKTLAEKEYQNLLYDPDSGLLNTKGADALYLKKKYEDESALIKSRYSAQARSPLTRKLLDSSLDALTLQNRRTILAHSADQRDKFRLETSSAERLASTENVALNYTDDVAFVDALNTVQENSVIEARAQGITSQQGIENFTRANVSQLYATRIEAMSKSENPQMVIQAENLYQRAKKNNRLTYKHLNDLGQFFDDAVPKATAELELSTMVTVPSQANSSINFVVDNLEGGDALADEPGGGVAKFGISSSVEGSVRSGLSADEVRGLSREQALEIYKKKYWDANDIDELPPSIRLVAFDTYVNGFDPDVLGYGADKAIELANGDPDKLLATRLRYYERLAEVNPSLADNLEGWRNRLKKLSVAPRQAKYDMLDVADRASEYPDDVAEQMIEQAEAHNKRVDLFNIRAQRSIMNLAQDPNVSQEEKLIAINRAELNGGIDTTLATKARRVAKGDRENISPQAKLEAFTTLTNEVAQLYEDYDIEVNSEGKADAADIDSTIIDKYLAFQSKVYAMTDAEITQAQARTFLVDFSAPITRGILENETSSGSLFNGITNPYKRGFKAIDTYLEAEGRENDFEAKRTLVLAFRRNLGAFDENNNYIADGNYKSSGDDSVDEKVIKKAFELAKSELVHRENPVLDTLGGTPNALINDGVKMAVREGESDLAPKSSVNVNYTIKTGRDGRQYRVYNDGRYEVIQ